MSTNIYYYFIITTLYTELNYTICSTPIYLCLMSEPVEIHEHVLGLQLLVLEGLGDVVLELRQHL